MPRGKSNGLSGGNRDNIYRAKDLARAEHVKQRETGFQRRKRRRRNNNYPVLAVIGLVLIVAIIFLFNMFFGKNAFEVVIGGERVDIIGKTKITSTELTESLTNQLSQEMGTNVLINEEIILKPVRVSKEDINNLEDIMFDLKKAVTYQIEGAIIMADGAKIIAMKNKEEADELIESIISEHIPEGANVVEKGFVQKVDVVVGYIDSAEALTIEEARDKLTEGTKTLKSYTIVSGDNFYKIATKNGTTVEQILADNPGMTINTKLRAGDTINVTVSTPFLSVKTTETQVMTEKQPKTIEYRTDEEHDSSYKKVIQQGRDGQKEVTIQIIRINGFVDEEKVIDEKVTVEPVTEIIMTGK